MIHPGYYKNCSIILYSFFLLANNKFNTNDVRYTERNNNCIKNNSKLKNITYDIIYNNTMEYLKVQ